MIIVIAPEVDVPNEIETLIMLFQKGLDYYHLRKPYKTYQEHCDYLNLIDQQYHNRIVVHDFHRLMNNYNLKGIHFPEQKRRDCESNFEEHITTYNLKGKTISSSFHDPHVLADCKIPFTYHLLSPVFTSISKKGYDGKGFNVNPIPKSIVALGGITTTTLHETFTLGYDGVGVLGAVWNNPDPVANFLAVKSTFKNLRP